MCTIWGSLGDDERCCLTQHSADLDVDADVDAVMLVSCTFASIDKRGSRAMGLDVFIGVFTTGRCQLTIFHRHRRKAVIAGG